jgi:hypothetical protein
MGIPGPDDLVSLVDNQKRATSVAALGAANTNRTGIAPRVLMLAVFREISDIIL